MEIGAAVITIVDKITTEGLDEIKIPKGTKGTICEIHDNYVYVEIWGKDAPKGLEGVFDFEINELMEIKR